jgi:hypothetical protein
MGRVEDAFKTSSKVVVLKRSRLVCCERGIKEDQIPADSQAWPRPQSQVWGIPVAQLRQGMDEAECAGPLSRTSNRISVLNGIVRKLYK